MGRVFGVLLRRRMHALAVAGCFLIGCGGAEVVEVSGGDVDRWPVAADGCQRAVVVRGIVSAAGALVRES